MHIIPKHMMKIGTIPDEFDPPVEVHRVEENTVIQATDSKIAITVVFPRVDPQEYPSLKGKDINYSDDNPVKVPGKVWVEGLKSVKKSRIRILENAVVSSEGIFSTDLQTTSEHQNHPQDEQSDFPSEGLNLLLEKAKKEDDFSIIISPNTLMKLFEAIIPFLDKKKPKLKITFPLGKGNQPLLLICAKGEKGEKIEALVATCEYPKDADYLHRNIRFFSKPEKD